MEAPRRFKSRPPTCLRAVGYRMNDSDDNRTTHWYYRLAGVEYGPVMTNRLRQLARQGELFADDLVRRGKMGEWIEAGTVEGLAVKPRAKPVAQAARPIAPPVETALPFDGPSLWQRLLYALYDLFDAIAGRFWLIRRVLSVVALIVVSVVLVRYTLTWDVSVEKPAPLGDPVMVYNSLWQEIQKNREAEADEEVWTELKERGTREIEPHIAALGKEAGSTNRVAQMLLWAGRDGLKKMFDDAREEPSRSEAKFVEYMQNVERLKKNEPIYGGNLGATHLYDNVRAMHRATSAVTRASKTTFATWGGIAAVNVGILAWLVRRWRRGR